MSGSSIHPCLGEVNGGRQSNAGSKHNTLYHFWQWSIISHKHQSTNDIYQKHMRNNKYIYANMKQYDLLV
ncbi:hypothetical protein BHE74_00038985 [Ensete ventricosum]|nr:hypothetical protein BHE74_00038985 [Ensete ventricosum]